MSEYRARIDQVLVHLFNDILRIEEESLHRRGVHGLSMREIHVLQAIMESGEENTMSAVCSPAARDGGFPDGGHQHAGAQGVCGAATLQPG